MQRLLQIGVLAAIVGTTAHGQVHFGAIVGTPINEAYTTSSTAFSYRAGATIEDGYGAKTKPLLIGPALQLGLPYGLAVELEGIYQRVNYEHYYVADVLTSRSRYFYHFTANRWQVPLLLQYRLGRRVARPLLEGGMSLSNVSSGREQALFLNNPFGQPFFSSLSSRDLPALRQRSVFGATIGVGADVSLRKLHFEPRVRYTRWASAQFSEVSPTYAGDLADAARATPPLTLRVPAIASKRDELQFVLGIRF